MLTYLVEQEFRVKGGCCLFYSAWSSAGKMQLAGGWPHHGFVTHMFGTWLVC